MKFYGLKKVTLIDYPGVIACTLFTHGCNFRCPFCHNPELVVEEPDEKNAISEKEVMDFLNKREGSLDGVVFTGGEPLIHGDKILAVFEKIKELKYKIKLDTNGSFPDVLKDSIEKKLVDFVAMDFKCAPENYYKMGVKKGMEKKFLESLSILVDSKIDCEIRTTVVPGLHDESEFKVMVKHLKGVKSFAVQNYQPAETLDPDYNDLEPFSEEELKAFANIVEKVVPDVLIRND